MANPLSFLTRLGDKVGSLGAVTSAMGCAVCYPAIASLGAAIGLGFLSQWEGVLFHVVLPLSAVLVILANGLGWFAHRQWQRTALGMIGPVLVLIGRYSFIRGIVYLGLAVMLAVAIWDLVSPAHRRCSADGSALPGQPGR